LPGYLVHPFHWPTYLEYSNSSAAPDSLFNLVILHPCHPAFKYRYTVKTQIFSFNESQVYEEMGVLVTVFNLTEGRETKFGFEVFGMFKEFRVREV